MTTVQASTQVGRVSSHTLPATDVPPDFEAMWAMANKLAEADEYVPAGLRGQPANVLALMLRARALDIPIAVAWDELFQQKNDVGQTAKLARALARRAGHRIAYVDVTPQHAIALIQCAGETTPHRVTFTLIDADRMGLLEGKYSVQWRQQPENMLVARVTTRAINRYCPEVLLGLGGFVEESVVEISSDVITAHLQEHRAAVAAVMQEADELTEGTPDGAQRRDALRQLLIRAREGEVLHLGAGNGRSVAQVLTDKLAAADELAKQQAADPDYTPPPAKKATSKMTPAKKTAKKAPAKKAAKKAPAKKAAKKAPAKKTAAKAAAAAEPTPEQGSEAQPPARPAAQPSARPAARPAGNNSLNERLPCGCIADHVMTSGEHADHCKDNKDNQ